MAQAWWVRQTTDDYHFNASFEHAGENADDNCRRRLCIIHKTQHRRAAAAAASFNRHQLKNSSGQSGLLSNRADSGE